MPDPRFDAKKAWRPVTAGLRVEIGDVCRGDRTLRGGRPGIFSTSWATREPRPVPSRSVEETRSRIRASFTGRLRSRGHRLPECGK